MTRPGAKRAARRERRDGGNIPALPGKGGKCMRDGKVEPHVEVRCNEVNRTGKRTMAQQDMTIGTEDCR